MATANLHAKYDIVSKTRSVQYQPPLSPKFCYFTDLMTSHDALYRMSTHIVQTYPFQKHPNYLNYM